MGETPRFNLLEEPWIPTIDLNGNREERSIREVLHRAHELREIQGDNPLETAALHRLLLAILHRAFGPPDLDAWTALWTRGGFDPALVDRYLDEWRKRFDLFDAERPFLQDPTLDIVPGPVAMLQLDRASGNNPTLFDHSRDESPVGTLPGSAARMLLAFLSYVAGGTVPNESKKPEKFGKHAAVRTGFVVLTRGGTLLETLLLNLVRYDPSQSLPVPAGSRDCPAWEADAAVVFEERTPRGWLDRLTWQCRRVLLVPQEDGDGLRVTGARVRAGVKDPEDLEFIDPMMVYRKDEKRGFVALSFSPSRAVWRDGAALLRSADGHRPKVFDELAQLVRRGALPRARLLRVELFGLAGDQQKTLLWRHERMPLPLAFLQDEDLVNELVEALETAESARRHLRDALDRLCSLVLAPESDGTGGRKPDRKAVSTLRDSLGAEAPYWAHLGQSFDPLVMAIAEDAAAALRSWRGDIRSAARGAFDTAVNALGEGARALKARVAAERAFYGELKKLLGEEEA